MAHQIFASDNMAYVGETPWHGLGNQLTHGAAIEDWLIAAIMSHKIKRAMVRYPVSSADADSPDAWRTMEDRHVLVRSDNGEAMGIVSDNYKVVQPREVLEFFRDLTETAGFALETAGTLFGGRKYWALASIGAESYVKDPRDSMKRYLLLSSSCDGTSATEGRYVDIRVVCNNTLGAAKASSKAKVKVSHKSVFNAGAAKIDLGVDAAHDEFTAAIEQFRDLANVKVHPAVIARETARLIVPGFDTFTAKEQMDTLQRDKRVARVGALAFGKARGSQYDGTERTAWGWLNAVTEYVDHEARARNTDNRFNSAVFGKGEEMKQQALQVAIAMADGSTVYRDAPVSAPADADSSDFANLMGRPASIV